MRFPLHVTTDMIKHQVRNAFEGQKRYVGSPGTELEFAL